MDRRTFLSSTLALAAGGRLTPPPGRRTRRGSGSTRGQATPPPRKQDGSREAGVGTLVLSHFVPADDPAVTEAMWAEAAATEFKGRIVVGRDLLEI